MTGIHYDDLTQIHTAFGLLDKDTAMRLEACERVEAYVGGKWVLATYLPKFKDHIVYRQAPPVERPIDVDWHALGPMVYCCARDMDGRVFAYSYDAKPGSSMWWQMSEIRPPVHIWPLTGLALLRDPGEGDWRKSRVINPLWQAAERLRPSTKERAACETCGSSNQSDIDASCADCGSP